MSNGLDSNYFRQGWQLYNRTYNARVEYVNVAKGTMRILVLDDLGIGREDVEINWGRFSFTGTKDPESQQIVDAFDSSWDRHCPTEGDIIVVAFGPKNEVKMLGYGQTSGLNAALYALKNDATQKTLIPNADFRILQRGEWDKRSSGGAYIAGLQNGELFFSAGALTTTRLSKLRNEHKTTTGLWTTTAQGSQLRFGTVKRLLPGTYAETDLSLLDPTALQEWSVSVATALPGGVASTLVATEELGAIRSSIGAPVLSGLALPLRSRKTVWAPGTTSLQPEVSRVASYKAQIDAEGNVEVSLAPSAVKASLTGVAAGLSATILNLDVTALGSASIGSTVSTSIDSVGPTSLTSDTLVSLGSKEAIDFVIKGTTFLAELLPVLSSIAAAQTALATALPTLVISPAQAVPVTTAVTALGTASGALAALVTSLPLTLSLKVVTE